MTESTFITCSTSAFHRSRDWAWPCLLLHSFYSPWHYRCWRGEGSEVKSQICSSKLPPQTGKVFPTVTILCSVSAFRSFISVYMWVYVACFLLCITCWTLTAETCRFFCCVIVWPWVIQKVIRWFTCCGLENTIICFHFMLSIMLLKEASSHSPPKMVDNVFGMEVVTFLSVFLPI